jgi:predicted DNA-binding ribbon-helix-helix protein
MNKRAVQIKKSEYPHRNSQLSLTFEAEIKRIAEEKQIPVGRLISELTEGTGITERQIYNYRSGRTDLPASLIPIFCKRFGSNALAMRLVEACIEIEYDEMDLFDLGRFASRSVQDVLRGHDDFIDAFDDGIIDGHELSKLSLTSQKMIRNAIRLKEIADNAYRRRSGCCCLIQSASNARFQSARSKS